MFLRFQKLWRVKRQPRAALSVSALMVAGERVTRSCEESDNRAECTNGPLRSECRRVISLCREQHKSHQYLRQSSRTTGAMLRPNLIETASCAPERQVRATHRQESGGQSKWDSSEVLSVAELSQKQSPDRSLISLRARRPVSDRLWAGEVINRSHKGTWFVLHSHERREAYQPARQTRHVNTSSMIPKKHSVGSLKMQCIASLVAIFIAQLRAAYGRR
ncbi:hypothetical protein FB567DRAFT_7063 [Paraphoma chrysanthemicola]|uniref:Uncharacterized protein n=1 Tax=Paraphoma chrysanthemicola TaxID=798071 RepID=A0A8K0RFX3_9PLEO|nr:hypothetical protein FB567DRAFT_7063 [Paraphoma chrysanthemicola]